MTRFEGRFEVKGSVPIAGREELWSALGARGVAPSPRWRWGSAAPMSRWTPWRIGSWSASTGHQATYPVTIILMVTITILISTIRIIIIIITIAIIIITILYYYCYYYYYQLLRSEDPTRCSSS